MSSPEVSSSFCVFCYKTINVPLQLSSNLGRFQFKTFLNFLQKHVQKITKSEDNELLLKINYKCGDPLKSCSECDIIIESFCELFKQIQSLELQLNSQLSQLKEVVELSSKIPSRLAKVNKALQLKFPDNQGKIEESRADFLAIRQTIISAGNRTESKTSHQPHSGTTEPSIPSSAPLSSNIFEDGNHIETSPEADGSIQVKLENGDCTIPEHKDDFVYLSSDDQSNDSNINLSEPPSTGSSSQLKNSNDHDYIICEICKHKIFNRRKHYHYEMCHDLTKVSAEEGVWTCDLDNCTAYFLNKAQLLAHKNKHDKLGKLGKCFIEYINGKKYFRCKSCKTSFDNLKYFRRHVSSTNCGLELDKKGVDSKAVKVKCPDCKKIFNKKENLWVHQNEVHSSGINKVCPKCGKSFNKTWSYKIHMEYHKGSANWKWECTKCKKRFATVHQLKRHAKSHLKGVQASNNDNRDLKIGTEKAKFYGMEGSKVCINCGVKWETDEELWKHGKEAHSKNVCLKCGKIFCGKAELKLHMEVHKDPKEWNWECKECGRRFRCESRLNDHMITHTNDKPFSCKFCGDRFPHRFSWIRHLKRVHGKEVERKNNAVNVSGKGAQKE